VHCHSFAMSQPSLLRAGIIDPCYHDGRIGRKPFAAGEINRQTDQHADASSAEAVTPTVHFAERAGDELRNNHAGINEDVINLKRARPPIVARRVERPDLARQTTLATTDADEKTPQRDE